MTAAAARKLQKEIDTVLKKVDDGIGEFAEFWEQATAAANNQQKEKLGEELKRSINKLQRLRVQIREWIAQSGVQSNSKDKLEDARRRIENDMQRFKDFERELKTKAFSTCALERADELELEEAEKQKYQDWLTQTIQSLNDQLDQFEADIEVLNNKKSLGSDDKPRLTQLKFLQERHRWHIKKLELVLRAVDNDAIDMSDLAIVRDSVDIYVESHMDPDCYHDEGLYDCFDLTEYEDKAPKPRSPSETAQKECSTPASSKEDSAKEPQRKTKEKEKRRKDDKKDKKKDEREKKASGTPQNAANSGGGSAKSNSGRLGDTKAIPLLDTGDSKSDGLREKLDPDEVKVQEDQLLSEAEEFICKICQIHVVGCSPKLTSCSHLFCGDCIAQWFAQHPESQTWAQRARAAGPERVVPCPVCKQPLNEKKDLYPVCGVTSRSENLLLWRMLSSLKIMCANHPKVIGEEGRCSWIGEYGSYQKHIMHCNNKPGLENGTTNSTEASSMSQQRALGAAFDSESEASSAPPSKDVSRKSTPAMTASPPATRVTPAQLPSPALAPNPQTHGNGATNVATAPVSGAVSPVTAPGRPQVPSVLAALSAPTSAPTSPALATGTAPAGAPAAPATPPATGAVTAPAATSVATVAVRSSVAPAPTAAAAPQQPAPASVQTPSSRPSVATEQQQVATPKASAPAHAPGSGAIPMIPATDTKVATPTIASPTATVAGNQGGPQNQTRIAGPEQPHEGDVSFVTSATAAFEPTGSNMIPVKVADSIQVIEQHSSGWTYAKNLNMREGNTGWVPSWIVQPPHSVEKVAPKPKANGLGNPSVASALTRTPQIVVPQPVVATQPAVPPAVQVAPAPTPIVTQPTPTVEVRGHKRSAQAAFTATSASQLTLLPGDLVEVVERHASGWTYGRKVSESVHLEGTLEGWFPDWVVCPQK